jgi:hypothetical protein
MGADFPQTAQDPQNYTTGPIHAHDNDPYGQYPNPQYGGHSDQPFANRSPQHDNHDYDDGRDYYRKLKAVENARAHWGKNYRTEPRYRTGSTYEDITVGGNTVTHAGDNVNYDHTEAERLARIPHLRKDNGRTDYRDRYNDQ